MQHLRTLYLAEPAAMLDVVQRRGAGARRVMLVAHNPGMHALALRLVGAGEPAARAELAEKFPTAALALVRFPGEEWRAAAFGRGELLGFWRPRELEG